MSSHFVRRGSSRLYVPRGFAEGEAFAVRGVFVPRRYFSMMVNSHRFGGGAGPSGPNSYYLDTDGSNGDGSIGSPWNTLEAARTGLMALHSSLVAATASPTLICTGATDDTTAVTNTWPTSSTTYYLTIKAPDVNRTGVWNAGHYKLVRSAAGAAVLQLSANSIRLQGIQLRQTSGAANSLIIEITALGGEFVLDGCLFRGSNGGNSCGIKTSGTGGTFVLRNFFILSMAHGVLLGSPTGLLTGSQVYVYNGLHWGDGVSGEACQITFAAGGAGRIARVKNMMMYAQTNGVTVTNADTDDQLTNSKGGVDVSHFVAAGDPGDWRLVSTSSNKDAGTDLSAVGAGQWQFSEDVSLYTRPCNGTWDRGFYEYRP
jgi:hypothetical protein